MTQTNCKHDFGGAGVCVNCGVRLSPPTTLRDLIESGGWGEFLIDLAVEARRDNRPGLADAVKLYVMNLPADTRLK